MTDLMPRAKAIAPNSGRQPGAWQFAMCHQRRIVQSRPRTAFAR
jgi:hypothetical protein